MSAVSVLNDVMGSVMRGPSSSHTAGAFRIARIVCSLVGEPLRSVVCTFDPGGSYAPTYEPLGVDLAFAAGVLGWEMTDDEYETSLQVLADSGVDLRFEVEPLEWADHPNSVRIETRSASGVEMTFWAQAVGGGLIEFTRLGESVIELDGKMWDLFAETTADRVSAVSRTLAEALPGWQHVGTGSDGDIEREHWRGASEPPVDVIESCARLRATLRISSPVFSPTAGREIYGSMQEMLAGALARGQSLGQAALEYEATLLDLGEEQCIDEMMRRYAIMRESIEAGLEDGNVSMQFTRPTASKLMESERNGQMALGGILSRVAARAIACMHICNSRGVVCAAPTGGSAGVVPAVILTLEDERGVDRDGIALALYAAAAVGLYVAKRATFAAESAGCQVEIGVAGAMGAAAVVESVGGTAQQGSDAASISLQNTMGLVCDPVGGGCEIPCVTRNGVAAANAFLCADLILGGYENAIPLDQTIDASYEVGQNLPCEVRCTSRGGLAVTPAALELARQAEERRLAQRRS